MRWTEDGEGGCHRMSDDGRFFAAVGFMRAHPPYWAWSIKRRGAVHDFPATGSADRKTAAVADCETALAKLAKTPVSCIGDYAHPLNGDRIADDAARERIKKL
jgi:hypothetical protein